MEVLQRTANRGSISTGYDIDNSLKMEADDFESMTRTPSSAGNRKTWTLSFWFKRTELGAAVRLFEAWDGSKGTSALFTDTDLFILDLNTASNYFTSTAVFRDTSAWYHFVIRVDTTQGTASERARVYVNGSELAGSWTGGYIGQNTDLTWNQNVVHYFGVFHATGNFANGYYAEIINVDGTSLAPTAFGEFDADSGIWKPKAASPTYGTNGFYLNFDNSASLGADSSGNGHTWTLNNITSADQATDTPTNNFCTLNPLFSGFQSTVKLPSNGATQYGLSGGNQDLSYAGTMGVTKGKWYFENYINEVVATYGARIYVGFHTFQQDYDGVQVGASTNGDALAVWQMDAGNYIAWNGGSRSITSGLGTVNSSGAGKFVGIALNLDDNQISFYYDGSAVTNGTNLSLYNMGSQTDDGIFAIPVVQTKGSIQTANFGGYTAATISSAASDANGYGTFEYAPPSGYYALCTKNLAEFG